MIKPKTVEEKKLATPICPFCDAVGNMAGYNTGPIFCMTCGAQFVDKFDLWERMNAKADIDASDSDVLSNEPSDQKTSRPMQDKG